MEEILNPSKFNSRYQISAFKMIRKSCRKPFNAVFCFPFLHKKNDVYFIFVVSHTRRIRLGVRLLNLRIESLEQSNLGSNSNRLIQKEHFLEALEQ